MALNIRDYTNIKVVQANHHKGDIIHSTSLWVYSAHVCPLFQ